MLQSNELLFLLVCMHRRLTDEHHQKASQLQGQVNADALYQLAADHGLTGLLYRGLLQLPDRAPQLERIVTHLAQAITQTAVLYEFIYPGQFAQLIQAFEQAGIETLLIKGHSVGIEVYQQPALRPYGDFDVLVHPQDLDKAQAVLVQLGYKPDESEHDQNWYITNDYHHIVPYVHQEWLPVEVHHKLTYNRYETDVQMDVAKLWHDARPFEVDGVRTKVLSREHLLMYLCIHAVNTHLFMMGLKPLCDINEALLAFGDQVDWSSIAQDCTAWGCTHQVYLLLRMVNYLFGTPLPDEAERHLRSEGFQPAFIEYGLTNILGATRISWDAAKVLQEKDASKAASLILRKVLPSRRLLVREYELPYPHTDARVWLYYPVWQVSAAGRFIRAMWRLRTKDETAIAAAQQEATRQNLINWLGDRKNRVG